MFIVGALSFAEEVESLLYFFFGSSLVDSYVADIAQKGEVDDARRVLFVVVHQFDECRVVVACDVECAVVFAYEAYGLVHAVGGESRLACAHVQFAYHAVCHCVSVQYRCAASHGKRFEGMSHCMAQIQCLAYAVLVWVGFDDALFHLDGFCHHALQLAEVGCVKIECHQFCPCALVGDESVLEHLGIARADVVMVECVEKLCVDDDETAVGEHTDFVLQSAAVDACLASH